MLGLVLTISSSSIPWSNMMTSLSIYAFINAPVMLTKATSLLSCASIYYVIITNSNSTVGDAVSFFWNPSSYFLPSAHARPLTVLSRFSLRNIINSSASYFSFSLMSATFLGDKVILVYIWFSYFSTDATPTFLKLSVGEASVEK